MTKNDLTNPRFEIREGDELICTFLARPATTDEWLKESALSALMSVADSELERAEAFAERLRIRLGILNGWEGVDEEEPGKPAPFSQENLVALLRQNPKIMQNLQHQLFLYFTPQDRVGK